jgi:hypothetical protein
VAGSLRCFGEVVFLVMLCLKAVLSSAYQLREVFPGRAPVALIGNMGMGVSAWKEEVGSVALLLN